MGMGKDGNMKGRELENGGTRAVSDKQKQSKTTFSAWFMV